MGSGEIVQCVQDLVTGAESADMMPDNPLFVVRCQFCESHLYACTTSQLALCRVYRQTQRSNKMLQSQWPRTTLNAFVFGTTIASATRTGGDGYATGWLRNSIRLMELFC